jgi:hypothetical protein
MSNYFSYFPTSLEDLTQNGKYQEVTNILRRFKIRNILKEDLHVYYDYDIKAGDRPDTIAKKYYGDSAYAWIVLHYNDITDPFFQWPLFNTDFDDYIKGKYGSAKQAQETVYEYRQIITPKQTLEDGTVVEERYAVIDETTYSSLDPTKRVSVSSYDYEIEKNEIKRRIKLLDKRYLNQIKGEVEDILRNGV